MSSPGPVLVTGAGGFIGGHVVEILHLTGLAAVRAGVRTWAGCARIGRFPVDIVPCDLLKPSVLDRALADVTSVVHCAVGPRTVICEGTRNLLEAALARGVKRVVHLSSTAVYGHATGVVDESRELRYIGDEYADAKIDAENVCHEFSSRGLPVVVLRPPIVYGPYSKHWTVNIVRGLASGRLAPLRDGTGKCNLLFVHDLVRAIVLALTSDGAVSEAFNITGPEVITWNDYFRRVSEGLGLSSPSATSTTAFSLKAHALEPVRALGLYMRQRHMGSLQSITARSDLARSLLKRAAEVLAQTPSSAEIRLFSRDVLYDAMKARRILGFVPRFGVDEGLRITNEWVRHEGCLTNGAATA